MDFLRRFSLLTDFAKKLKTRRLDLCLQFSITSSNLPLGLHYPNIWIIYPSLDRRHVNPTVDLSLWALSGLAARIQPLQEARSDSGRQLPPRRSNRVNIKIQCFLIPCCWPCSSSPKSRGGTAPPPCRLGALAPCRPGTAGGLLYRQRPACTSYT